MKKLYVLLLACMIINHALCTEYDELYSANFTTLENHNYTKNKIFILNGKEWMASCSHVESSIFYLGSSSQYTDFGYLSNNTEFVDVSLALAAADGVYKNYNSTTHAYALQFNNAYNDVTKVEFAWSGGGYAFIIFLFGDKGNGFEQLKYTIYSDSGASKAGSVVWTGAATDYSRFAIVARPGSTLTGAIDKMLRASTFKIYTDHKDWKEVRTELEVDRNYTLCLEKNITEVKGATFWSIHNYNSSDQAVYLEEETAPLDAGKPYIYQATADKLEVVYGDQTAAAPVENGALRGTFSTMDADALTDISGNVYMMYNNALHPIGTDNHLDAHRAYLLYEALVPGEPTPLPGRQVRKMPMQDNTATALDLSNTADAPGKTLINGHLFILRGEHTYDLSGCKVK